MKELTFKHEQFGEVRAMTMPDGQIGFVGKDVAEALGYSNASKAVIMHVDEEDKLELLVYLDSQNGNAGQRRKTTFISESGLYSLILSSKLPSARKFKHWVTAEVLPQIRKTGGYIPVAQDDDEKTILAKACTILMRTVEMQKASIEQQQAELASQDLEIARLAPRAEYAEEVLLSPTCYTMTEVAKSLSMTVRELQRFLHSHGIIYRNPAGRWMLYAAYLKQGLEAYRTHKGQDLFGNVMYTDTYLVWTERGKEFIHQFFRNVAA